MNSKSNGILTIIGCGTSTGVPIPACKCSVCCSDNPKNHRNRTSAWLTTQTGHSILIDAGPDLRQQALQFSIPKVDKVLFTHAHADHILGIEDLRGFNFKRSSPIECHATSTTIDAISRTFPYIVNPDPNYQGGKLVNIKLNEFDYFKEIDLEGIKITPFPLMHGKMEVTGYLIGNLAYATDCNFIPESSRELISDIDFLILDGLRQEAHGTHFSIPEAIIVSKELKAKQTYLIHMTHTVEYEATSAMLPENIELCYDGLEIPVFLP